MILTGTILATNLSLNCGGDSGLPGRAVKEEIRMCGILGYVGQRNSLPILIEGLRRLEYRGYDSAGVAFQNGNGIEIFKTSGKIRDLEAILPGSTERASAGLGHTRWATHGIPTTVNAHPHRVEGIAVVHNGIIENYRELKNDLVRKGMSFTSDTDTEVIPQMISWFLKEGHSFREALASTVGSLTGYFAIGVMHEGEPQTLYAVRNRMPLVIGFGQGDFYFASDTPALLPYTRKCMYPADKELCVLSPQGVTVERLNGGKPSSPEEDIVEIAWTPSMAEKEGYEHFMLKEINEQPQGVSNTLSEWIDDPLTLLESAGLSSEKVFGLRRLHIVACGTSYHAALIGKYMIESLARIPVDVDIASEYRYRKPIIENGHTFFISITQSGETADTLAAQREARENGAQTLTICNVVGSTVSREADAVLYTRGGPEISVASTKAFTAQLAALTLLAIGLGIKRGRLFAPEAESLKAQLKKMPESLDKMLEHDGDIMRIAGAIADAKGCLYLGRGINYPIALEGALKMKEITYIHAEGYAAGEMKHGPIALIEPDLPVIVLAPVDNLYQKTLANIEEVKARGGRVIAVTDETACMRDKAEDLIPVISTHPVLSPFVTVIPMQLLAYHAAVIKGCDVDQPRNLAKSVTVE
jgi:glucosamine--fructose-6-phosphate aminotransferase (isomerizing)